MVEKNKVDIINVIKFIAFLCVFFLHAKIFAPSNWNQDLKYPWITFTPAWAGVWIFLFLSGYGIGAGFFSGKYIFDMNGIINFYKKRLISIVPIYYLYLIIVLIFVAPGYLLPSRDNIYKLLKLFLFNYHEEFGSLEFGAAWYLSTLMALYLIAPIIFYIWKRWFSNKKRTTLLIILLFITQLSIRLLCKYHFLKTGVDNWSPYVYKPFYMNLDIFVIGFLLNAYRENVKKINTNFIPKAISLIAFIGLIGINSYLYYYGSYAGKAVFMNIYQYILPSVYLILLSTIIYFLDIKRNFKYTKLSKTELKKNYFRILDYFPKISLIVYLFHSNILRSIQSAITADYVQNIANKIKYTGSIPFLTHILIMVIAFLATIILSIILFNLSKNIKNLFNLNSIKVKEI